MEETDESTRPEISRETRKWTVGIAGSAAALGLVLGFMLVAGEGKKGVEGEGLINRNVVNRTFGYVSLFTGLLNGGIAINDALILRNMKNKPPQP